MDMPKMMAKGTNSVAKKLPNLTMAIVPRSPRKAVVAIILIGISIYVKYLIKKEIKKTTEQ